MCVLERKILRFCVRGRQKVCVCVRETEKCVFVCEREREKER